MGYYKELMMEQQMAIDNLNYDYYYKLPKETYLKKLIEGKHKKIKKDVKTNSTKSA